MEENQALNLNLIFYQKCQQFETENWLENCGWPESIFGSRFLLRRIELKNCFLYGKRFHRFADHDEKIGWEGKGKDLLFLLFSKTIIYNSQYTSK